jgi:hypothetical protein
MPRLTDSEVRFELRRGLQSLPRGVVRDLAAQPAAREKAMTAAVEVLALRFVDKEVIAPEPSRMDFGDMKNG